MSPTRSFARLHGFRDFPPAELELRRTIFGAWREVAERSGFREYDGPPLEPLDLYVAKSGPEIVEQIYAFRDKGGRAVAMRPEMTPSLARILAERSRGMAKPVRWFSIPQLFRYERSQRGRLREHFQLNVDIVGEASVAADAEVLAVAIDAVRGLGLDEKDFAARINDRRLVAAVMDALGIPDDGRRADCLAAIDKAGRAGPDRTLAALGEAGADEKAARTLTALIEDGSLANVHWHFGDCDEVVAAIELMWEHEAHLEAMGLSAYLEFDFKVVRGLPYYTGVVFELFDRAGEMRAICGGGRYDRLLELVGGEPLPAVGFGMGDVVLGELLRDRGLVPEARPHCRYFVVAVTPEERPHALRLVQRLREAGHTALYDLRQRGVGKQLREASRAGAQDAIIIGPDEAAAGMCTIRNMNTGNQEQTDMDSLAARQTRRERARGAE